MTTPEQEPTTIRLSDPATVAEAASALSEMGAGIAAEGVELLKIATAAREAAAVATGPADCAGVIAAYKSLMEAVGARLDEAASDARRGGQQLREVGNRFDMLLRGVEAIDGEAARRIAAGPHAAGPHLAHPVPMDRPAGG